MTNRVVAAVGAIAIVAVIGLVTSTCLPAASAALARS